MKVRCVDIRGFADHLTLGKIYIVLEEITFSGKDLHYKIEDDNGSLIYPLADRFEVGEK